MVPDADAAWDAYAELDKRYGHWWLDCGPNCPPRYRLRGQAMTDVCVGADS